MTGQGSTSGGDTTHRMGEYTRPYTTSFEVYFVLDFEIYLSLQCFLYFRLMIFGPVQNHF